MERLNDHRHVHNQCACARGCVHVFDFCHDWTMAINACICISRTFNEPRAFIWHASDAECTLVTLTVALTGAADMFVNWRARR